MVAVSWLDSWVLVSNISSSVVSCTVKGVRGQTTLKYQGLQHQAAKLEFKTTFQFFSLNLVCHLNNKSEIIGFSLARVNL